MRCWFFWQCQVLKWAATKTMQAWMLQWRCGHRSTYTTWRWLRADGYNFKCNKLCMNGMTTCSHWWRVYDVDTDGIGSLKCTHGWLPRVCNECCDEIDDSPNEDCPQKNVCTTECTVKKFVSVFHVCLEERMDTLTTREEECKPCPYRQPEPGECPYYWIAKRIAQ